jgi:hypothetical protein
MNIHSTDIHSTDIHSTDVLKISRDFNILGNKPHKLILINIINDDDTFLVSYYNHEIYLDILDKWYKLIDKDYYIKETGITPLRPRELKNYFPNSIDLKLIDIVNNEINQLNEYYKLEEQVRLIKSKYQSKKQQTSISGECCNKGSGTGTGSSQEKNNTKDVVNRDVINFNSEVENWRIYDDFEKIRTIRNVLEPYNEQGDILLNENVDYSYINDNDNDNNNDINVFKMQQNKYNYLYKDNDEISLLKPHNILILYHNEEMKAAVINDYTQLEKHLAENGMFGFELIKILNLKGNQVIIESLNNDLNKKINNKIFNTKAELEEHINIILKLNNDKKLDEIKEKQKIYEYFENYINKEDNIEHKVKFSDISSKIQEYFNIEKDDIKFRHRLSRYLIDYGFKKKRFTDGFYYYGITFKDRIDIKDISIGMTGIGGLDKLIKEREEDLKNIKLNNSRNKNINFEINRPLDEGLMRSNKLKKTT